MSDFTHFNNAGRAMMVDIGSKDETQRTAVAAGAVRVNADTGANASDVLILAMTFHRRPSMSAGAYA